MTVEVLSWPSLAFELFRSAGTGLSGLCPRCPSGELGQLPALTGAVILLVSAHVGWFSWISMDIWSSLGSVNLQLFMKSQRSLLVLLKSPVYMFLNGSD